MTTYGSAELWVKSKSHPSIFTSSWQLSGYKTEQKAKTRPCRAGCLAGFFSEIF